MDADTASHPQIIAHALSTIVGSTYVRLSPELSGTLTGQAKPIVSVRPCSEEEVAAILGTARESGWKLVIVGGGTQLSFGNPIEFADIAICMDRFHVIVDHSPADMVVTVQSGVKLSELEKYLAGYGQTMAIDAAMHPDATIGGLVATGVSGPMRALYGTVRDMLIATRVVIPDEAAAVRTGSKVVKNVAGYDVSKLMIGSLGTLGVLTECTFKLKPLPAHRELCILTGSIEQMEAARSFVMDSSLIASSLELATMAQLRFLPAHANFQGPWALLIGCDETAASAAFQTNTLLQLAEKLDIGFLVLQGPDVHRFWAEYRADLLSASLIERVQLAPTELCGLAVRVRERARSQGIVAKLSFSLSAGVGRVFASSPSGQDGELTLWDEEAIHNDISRIAADFDAATVIERGSLDLRRKYHAFHSVRQTSAHRLLMQGIKDAFDSEGLLAGGI